MNAEGTKKGARCLIISDIYFRYLIKLLIQNKPANTTLVIQVYDIIQNEQCRSKFAI